MVQKLYSPTEKRLRIGMTYGNVHDLPAHSTGPRGSVDAIYAATAKAGYQAMQGGEPALCKAHGLELLGVGIIPTAADAEKFIAHWKELGAVAATAIVGYGYESDAEIDELAATIVALSASYQLPTYIETHRASITQDTWRTVQLTERVPQVRLNGDFSHWFAGQEMGYGDFNERLNRLQPVFDRVRFLHGRIAARCCVQVDIGNDLSHESIPSFREFWTRAMFGFLKAEDSGSDLWFCPELLGTEYRYAHVYPNANGVLQEDGDRWTQAELLVQLAKECFAEASRQALSSASALLYL